MRFFPQVHIEIERWKYCRALDIYVSNMGRLKDREGNLQKVCTSNGYLHWKGKPVHRIVMQAWNPVPGYDFLTVDHLDHNTRNNKLSNLEWVTAEENKARDKADRIDNEPIKTVVNISDNQMFLVNKVAMSLEAAKQMLRNDKSLSGTANIDRAFEKAAINKTETKFGNYTIQYIKEK